MERSSPPPTTLIAGAIAGALPFAVSMASYSARFENGRVVEATYRDWVAVGGGAAAVICGLAAIVVFARAKKTPMILAGVAILALGGYQIARGLGVFFTPEAPPGMRTDPIAMRDPIDPPAAPAAKDPATCPTQDACDNLAEELKKTDMKASRIANARSCDFGAGYACEETAEAWQKDDPAKARAFYDKACTLKRGMACNQLAVMYITGEEGTAKDPVKGAAYLAKSCDAGEALGCKNLAVAYRDGLGVTADPAKATEYAIKSCGIDHWMSGDADAVAYACDYAGNSYLKGRGVAVDKKAAVEHYGRACERSKKYCFNLAAAYEQGVVETDLPRARELFAVGCDADDTDACNNLGNLLNKGLGGPKDAAKAKLLFKRACDAGLELGCNNLKGMK